MSASDIECLPLEGRLIAFDLGEVRVGVALSDPRQIIASPFETVTVPRADDGALIGAIERAIVRHDAAGVVIGLPTRLDGREGAAARRARDVAKRIATSSGVPVLLWDERYTTVEAERSLVQADLSRSRRREVIDQVAASVVLQSVLDAQRRRRELAPDAPQSPPADQGSAAAVDEEQTS